MNKFRKAFVAGIMSITVISMSMIAVPFEVGAAAAAGDLIKMDGLSSVYYLAGDGKRYVFPNEATYFSWYSDFSGVKTIPQSELETYPLGKNVTMRPGTKLVKITTDPKVYAVTPDGKLIWVPSETVASTLWGTNWAKRIVDVSDAFFTNYTILSGEVAASAYPAGSLIKYSGAADVYFVDGNGKARKITSESAFLANRFKWDDVVNAPDSVPMPVAGTDITAYEEALADTSSGAGGTPGAGTGLTVALAGTTALSTTIITNATAGQSNANMASFNLTASNDGEVKVTTIKLKRVGISSDTTLSAVYLYDGTTRLTDSASVSSGYMTWNNASGITTVAAGTTKTITVKADVNTTAGAAAGETIAVSVNAASDITTNGAAVSGSFPITGNTMSVASATLGTFAVGTALPSGTGEVTAGETDYSLWKNTVTIGTRYLNLSGIRLRMIGSVGLSDLKNLKFYVDGVQRGDAVATIGSDSYVYFGFATPVKLDTGSRVLEMRGDVINGSNKTYSWSLQYAIDIEATDSEYGVSVKPTGTIPATTGVITVSVGTLSVEKASDSPSGTVTKDATGATLAKYTFKAYGEPIKIEYLSVAVVEGNSENDYALRNGAVFANGVQVGSTAAIPSKDDSPAFVDYNLGSSLVVTPGTPVTVEVRADIYDSAGTNNVSALDTVQIRLKNRASSAQRQSSLGYIDVPGSDKDANPLTVAVGSLTLAKQGSYADQNVTLPKNADYKLGSYVLTNGSYEAVTLNTIMVQFASVTNDTFAVTDLSDVYVKYGTKSTSIKATVGTASSTWSINETLAKNGSLVLEVWGKVPGTATAEDSIRSSMTVSGITTDSSTNSEKYATGQTLVAKDGSLTISKDGGSATTAIVKANTTVDAVKFKFAAANDSYVVTEVVATTTSAGASVINQATLKDGSTVLATAYFSGTTVTFGGLVISIPANTSKVLTVSYDLGSVGTGAGTSGANIVTALKSYKSAPSSTGVFSTTSVYGVYYGNDLYVYKAIPTIAAQTLPSTILVGGSTNTLAKFSITGDGDVAWKRIIFAVATSSHVTTLTAVDLYDSSGTQIPNVTCTAAAAGASVSCEVDSTYEETVSGSKTYVLKGTVNGGSITTADYVSTSIGSVSTVDVPKAYGSVGATATFVWSDVSNNLHTTLTEDWNNEFLVKSLPTDTWTLTK